MRIAGNVVDEWNTSQRELLPVFDSNLKTQQPSHSKVVKGSNSGSGGQSLTQEEP